MYDHNGLALTPVADSMNSYLFTTVVLKIKKFAAYAPAHQGPQKKFGMAPIGYYADARDAAFVAQEFVKHYDKHKTRQLVTDGLFSTIAREFRESIEIPEWKYDAEGFTIAEIMNGGYDDYKKNYVDNAKDALVEALRVAGKKTPDLKVAAKMIARVNALYSEGNTYRAAAKMVVEG